MSQDWTEDVYDKDAYTAHVIMTNIELMFKTLKTTFSGTSAPADLFAGVIWLDTNNHLLRIRNEANDGWITILDLANFGAFLDVISEKQTGVGVTIDGVLLKDSEVTTDVINEGAGADGVTIDNMKIKDGEIPLTGLPTDGVTFEKIQHGSIMLPCIMSDTEAFANAPWSGAYAWTTIVEHQYRIYVPTNATTLRMALRGKRAAGNTDVRGRFTIGGLYSPQTGYFSISYTWDTTSTLDVSSLSGWQTLAVQGYSGNDSNEVLRMQGFSFVWE